MLSLAWMVLITTNIRDGLEGADTIHLGPVNVPADGAVGFAIGAPFWYLMARHRRK